MTDECLRSALERIDINECEEAIDDYIYYCNILVKQRCYPGEGSFQYVTDEYDFLVITDRGKKQAIILKCGYSDLQWHVLRKCRGNMC